MRLIRPFAIVAIVSLQIPAFAGLGQSPAGQAGQAATPLRGDECDEFLQHQPGDAGAGGVCEGVDGEEQSAGATEDRDRARYAAFLAGFCGTRRESGGGEWL